jgi:hypothetical protein
MMIQQRERWNSNQLTKLRTGLRSTLAILSYTSEQDKEEIETRVMDALKAEVASVSDHTIERTSLTHCIGDDLNTDSLVIDVLLEQHHREEWAAEFCS